jgi:hypothetical protein
MFAAECASLADRLRGPAAHLWDRRRDRTSHPSSPHRELSDVWVRYAAPGVFEKGPHESVWYPEEAELLPELVDIAYLLMSLVRGDQLGGVLVTRIPPGAQCYPHTDPGWHARHYEKFGVQVAAAPGQRFHVEDLSLETAPGDVFTFDNARSHWVTNDTEHERITAIVCIRRYQQARG